ncbi:MAG TPA: PQQ-binding-like beta-propeller repeat protein [Phycisphaerales bacterium]|nr:PQQ-binding-like beta-propeller repeat protein [Phycisphaerales bacterium]
MTTSRLAFRFSLALLTAAAVSGGCSENSALSRVLGRHEEPPPPLKGSEAIDRDAYGKLGYALAWSSFVPFDHKSKATVDKAALLGDLLVISDDTTATSALTTTSGSLKWSLQVDDRAGRFKSISRLGDAVITTNETEVFMINAETGQLADRQRFSRLSSTAPIVLGDLFTYGSGEMVVGHSLGIKEMAWAYRFPAPIKVDPVWTGGTTACFISSDGSVGILDCATGTMVGAGRMFGNAGAAPAVGDGAVFVAGADQSLWAFNVDSGARRWQVRTEVPLTVTPSVFGQRVMVHVPGTGVVCVNSRTGDQEWVNKTLTGTMVASRKGNPIFWDRATGIARVIDAARGDVIDEAKLENVAMIVNGGRVADGDLYTISARGEVSKFIPR